MEKKISLDGQARDFKNPKCVLIIGNKSNISIGQLKSLDLVRYNFQNLEIITFDEIFERIRLLKEIFLNNNV